MSEVNDRTAVSLEYLLGLTAFSAGAVDVISFAKLGGIFTSAMTGNLAFLGLYLASGAIKAALGSTIALIGFVAGAAIANLAVRGRGRHVALTMLLSGEALLFATAAILWFFLDPHKIGTAATDCMITLLAIAMGAQSILGKQINLSNIPTVVFTSTLTNIVIGVTDMLANGKKFNFGRDTKRQLTSFMLYLVGAFVAGLTAYFNVSAIILLPLISMAAALGCHFWGRRS